jgi:hypothetical protein
MNYLRGPVAAWNEAAWFSKGEILIQLSDDWDPPMHWDKLIIDAIGDTSKPAVLAVSDGHRTDNLLCMAILTRARYKEQGYLFHPDFFSMFSDNHFTDRAYADDVVIDAKHIVMHLDEERPEGVENESGGVAAAHRSRLLLTVRRRRPSCPPPPPTPHTHTVEQIAFADRILLNKTDLVSQSEVDSIKQRIKVRGRGRRGTMRQQPASLLNTAEPCVQLTPDSPLYWLPATRRSTSLCPSWSARTAALPWSSCWALMLSASTRSCRRSQTSW